MKLKEIAKNHYFENKFGYVDGYFDKDGYFFLSKILVYSKFRNKGYAKELMKEIPYKAKLLAYPLFNETGEKLDINSLIKFYEKCGFELKIDDNHSNIMIRG